MSMIRLGRWAVRGAAFNVHLAAQAAKESPGHTGSVETPAHWQLRAHARVVVFAERCLLRRSAFPENAQVEDPCW
jgi:hypothetical protein